MLPSKIFPSLHDVTPNFTVYWIRAFYFRNFRVNADGSRLSSNSPLYQNGRMIAAGSSQANSAGTHGDWLVASFADDVKNNRLPSVSWICAPNDYTEHAPNSPNAGENLAARLLAALVANPDVWSKTVFLLTYDENDGFFDHMPPAIPPLTTAMGRTTLANVGEYENYQGIPVGLGPRVPMLIISPWTKGGRVCSQLFDHTSQLRFLEEWLVARGRARAAVTCNLVSPWRRTVCGDLTSAFDFVNPDSAWPASVPKTTTYTLVNGKPTPAPPANQVLPRQERCTDPSNTRIACALPYLVSVQASADAARLNVNLRNSGRVGASFIAYSSVRTDGPWYYAVEAGKSIDNETWNWTTPTYDLAIYGPNGFLRQFKGSTTNTAARPEVSVDYDVSAPGVTLYLSNLNGSQPCVLTISDNSYGGVSSSHTVNAGATIAVSRALGASFGWYDFSVRSNSDGQFLRRVAGHIETGTASRTDPVLGTNRSQQQALSAAAGYVQKGSGFTLNYVAPASKLDAKNWIGIYAPGTSPGKGAATQWVYAPQANGSWVADSSTLAVADYNAWYLYKDGYETLGGPVAFCV